MTSDQGTVSRHRNLRLGLVLSSQEEDCTVVVDGHSLVLPYALPFPRPRVDRVDPGHLVAIAPMDQRPGLVIWRWLDAVVTETDGAWIELWEPHHGSFLARPRDPQRVYLPGTRAYASAGLPGAEWWVAGLAVQRGEEADVDLDQVAAFFSEHDLWEHLA